uniref:U4/U6 small nuclear ribonucleoprotein PRP4 n=1 Tax=Lygus hesperus TaxID=30085 RepID=A0A0A9YUM8_LYGHE
MDDRGGGAVTTMSASDGKSPPPDPTNPTTAAADVPQHTGEQTEPVALEEGERNTVNASSTNSIQSSESISPRPVGGIDISKDDQLVCCGTWIGRISLFQRKTLQPFG